MEMKGMQVTFNQMKTIIIYLLCAYSVDIAVHQILRQLSGSFNNCHKRKILRICTPVRNDIIDVRTWF